MSGLAQRQQALVDALVGGAPMPPGFDEHRLAVAREALLRKRSSEVGDHIPLVRAELGEHFHELFGRWASQHRPAGTCADAHAFTDHLIESGHWTPPPTNASRNRIRQWTTTLRRR